MERIVDHSSLTLPSVFGSVETLEQMAESFALRAGFDEEGVCDIVLVVREAAVNAVLHGNRHDPTKVIRAEFAVTSETLTIQISDEGEGFDPERVVDPLLEENRLRTSGRGVFLMRSIMDEVNFMHLNQGTKITLIRHRTNEERE